MHDIQVFLGFANFYQRFIQGFSKIVGSFTLMLKTTSSTSLSTILQLFIDMADKDKVGGSKSSGNKTNLSNLSALKESTGAGYLTSKGAKKAAIIRKRVLKPLKAPIT